VEYFAGPGFGWKAKALDAASFDVTLDDQPAGRVTWGLVGEHNQHNALAAIAAARHAGVPPQAAIDALSRFQNVKRRLELRGTVNGIAVYDDFAHHPTAIATTLAGLRSRVGAARILAVLEPRSNTMKLGILKDQLAGSLQDAQKVFCYAKDLGWDAAAALRPLADRAAVYDDLDALVEAVAAQARSGDQILTMSNGGFGSIHAKLLTRLAR